MLPFRSDRSAIRPFAVCALAIAACVYVVQTPLPAPRAAASEGSSENARGITIVDAYYFHKEGRALFVDLRTRADFDSERIAGAVHFDDDSMVERAQAAPNIVIYGGTRGDAATKAESFVRSAKAGSAVYLLNEDVSVWAALGLPMAK